MRLTDAPADVEAEPKQRPKAPRTKQPKAPRTRDGSKQAQLIAMLRRAKGATIDEIAEALSWQPHTVRGAIAGALKKKLGLEVTSEKDEKRGRVYRVTELTNRPAIRPRRSGGGGLLCRGRGTRHRCAGLYAASPLHAVINFRI